MFAEFRQIAQRLDEIVAKSDRMRRGKAEPLQAIDLVHRLEQLHEGTFVRLGHDAGYSGKLVPTVEVHDLAQERHFFYSVRDKLAHFAHDFCDRAAALGAARPRHDAKSAMHVAALHDGNKGRRLPRPQRVIADRFLRAALLLGVADREAGVVHGATGLTHPVHRGALPCAQFLDIIRDAMKFLRADDEIDMRQPA